MATDASKTQLEQDLAIAESKLEALADERGRLFARQAAGENGDGLEERLVNVDRGVARLNNVAADLRDKIRSHDRLRELASNPDNIERAVPEPEIERDRNPDRDQALRTIERHTGILRSDAADRLDELVRSHDSDGKASRYLSAVGDPAYNSAFGKMIHDPTTGHLRFSREEVEAVRAVSEIERAMSLTGASGGFGVPFNLDPSIINTSAGASNPFRQISRVIQIAVDEWRGVSSAGVTAAYAAEATETTDNAPTLVQPTISTEKAQAFVPFSIEVGQDWPSLQEELRILLQDAKDTLEATKFVTGTGTNEPFGVAVGTTNTVNATTGQTFTIANLYSLMEALPSRYQDNASWVGNLAILNRVRRFGETTTGEANVWVDRIENNLPNRLLGHPVYEASAMPATPATGNKFLIYGDFSRYVIVDRIGLQVELIPHLLGANRRPTGERGLYAYWRNGAKVVDAGAFRALLGIA